MLLEALKRQNVVLKEGEIKSLDFEIIFFFFENVSFANKQLNISRLHGVPGIRLDSISCYSNSGKK